MARVRASLIACLALAAAMSGCASVEPPAQADSANPAVVALLDDARGKPATRPGEAAASLERALRIEPRNPRLWQELARVRLSEGDFAQAESLAARANTWSGKDNRLRAENWRIIAEARSRRGDQTGAKAAVARAERYER